MRVDQVPDWMRAQAESARAAAHTSPHPAMRAALRGKAVALTQAENTLRQALESERTP